MKKIAFYIGMIESGGAARVMTNLANQFVSYGYDVLFIINYSGQNEYHLNSKIHKVILDEHGKKSAFISRNLNRIIKLKKWIISFKAIGLLAMRGAVLSVILLYRKKNTGIMKNIFYILSAVMSAAVLLASGSRKVLAGLFLIIFMYLAIQHKGDVKKNILYFLTAVTALVIILNSSLLNGMISSRFHDFVLAFSGRSQGSSISERKQMLLLGMKTLIESPLIGKGLNTYKVIYAAAYHTAYLYSHNNYLEIAVNLGVIGLSIYYSVYLYILPQLRKIIKRTDSRYVTLLYVMLLTDLLLQLTYVSYSDISSSVYIIIAMIVIRDEKRIYARHMAYGNG